MPSLDPRPDYVAATTGTAVAPLRPAGRRSAVYPDLPVSSTAPADHGQSRQVRFPDLLNGPATQSAPAKRGEMPVNVETGADWKLDHRFDSRIDAEGRMDPGSTPGRRVGIDLQCIGPGGCGDEDLSESGVFDCGNLLDSTTLRAFRSAAWRALGSPETIDIDAVQLRFDDVSLRDISLNGHRMPAGGSILSPWPGFVLAVVWIDEPVF